MAARENYRNGSSGNSAQNGRAYVQPGSVSDETRIYNFEDSGGNPEYYRSAGGSPYDGQSGQDASGGYGYQNYQNYQNNGYYSGYPTDSGYVDGRNGYQEAYRRPAGPSMASRASGKANPDPYRSGQQQAYYPQQNYYRQQAPVRQDPFRQQAAQPKRRRRKRHPFRKLLTFLLMLALLITGGYFLLFRAPSQSQRDGFTRKSGFYNILLCATDEDGERTDTMMLLSVDQKNRSVSLTSLPRDTLLENGNKLNSVYILNGCGEDGAEALMDTVETMLGFRPDGYAVISYQVFRDAVDAMGGVWFDVPMDMTVDYANDDDDDVFIPAGEQLLDGDTALRVCRYRAGYAMADIQRVYVQQSFVKAMVKQCLSPKKWIRLPKVYQAVMENTITDLSGANLRYIALWTMLSFGDGLTQNTLPGEGVSYYGASCYGLFGLSVVDLINETMNPYEEEIGWEDVSIYSVSYGELVPSEWYGDAFDAGSYTYN